MLVNGESFRTLWMERGHVHMIDQTLLPHQFEVYPCPDWRTTAEAIRTMVVRGAGAIGTAAAYALAQAVADEDTDWKEAYEVIRGTRPTAVDLFNGTDFVRTAVEEADSGSETAEAIFAAEEWADNNALACEQIGENAAHLIEDGFRVATHCNAGWLAFVDWGSALSPIFKAAHAGREPFVFVDETRPRNQGANLTAWELVQENVDHAVIVDNALGHFMAEGEVDLMITGADRIAANGDVANKIGTYEKAVVAHENDVPFYVAAPSSTLDPDCSRGGEITIEQRDSDEVLFATGWSEQHGRQTLRVAAPRALALNPAFDVTPARFITGIVTEHGIFKPGHVMDSLKAA